jgi:hypothetical protein
MKIIIETATDELEMAALRRVRSRVFTQELGLVLPPLTNDAAATFHLLARAGAGGEAVAALSVVETSGDDELHGRYGLAFPPGARVARYTQLAVLRPFRGLHLPLRLIVEAQRRFIAPGFFDYTWLLFDAERAASSQLCRWLAFAPGAPSFTTEYGRSRVLLRDEAAPQARAALRRTAEFVAEASSIRAALVGLPSTPAPARAAVSI